MLKVCSDYTYCGAPLRPFSLSPPPSTWQRKEKSNTVEQPGITHKREKEKASRQPDAAPPSNLMLIPGVEERKEEAFIQPLSHTHILREDLSEKGSGIRKLNSKEQASAAPEFLFLLPKNPISLALPCPLLLSQPAAQNKLRKPPPAASWLRRRSGQWVKSIRSSHVPGEEGERASVHHRFPHKHNLGTWNTWPNS